jgi:hypothetical protein
MRTTECNELYTDEGHHAVMTRTTILKYAQLTRIADHLCQNAEQLLFSTNSPSVENCRIAGTMLGWAYKLTPLRIGTRFDD